VTAAEVGAPAAAPIGVARFVAEVLPPQVYVTYAALWVLLVDGTLAVRDGRDGAGGWRLDGRLLAEVAVVVLMLLLFRILDEEKDLDYDREHHPERPVARGAITVAQLRAPAVAVAAVVLGTAATLSVPAALVLAASQLHAWFLVGLERRSARVRDGLLLNLAVTYPVQLLVGVAVVLMAAARPDREVRTGDAVAVLVLTTLIFLHVEFARKTRRANDIRERMYSDVLGAGGSAAVTAALPIAAVALAAVLLRPAGGAESAGWAVCGSALLVVVVTLGAFLAGRIRAWPKPAAMLVLVLVDAGLITVAAVRSDLAGGWW
jgi:hypothetical protein